MRFLNQTHTTHTQKKCLNSSLYVTRFALSHHSLVSGTKRYVTTCSCIASLVDRFVASTATVCCHRSASASRYSRFSRSAKVPCIRVWVRQCSPPNSRSSSSCHVLAKSFTAPCSARSAPVSSQHRVSFKTFTSHLHRYRFPMNCKYIIFLFIFIYSLFLQLINFKFI